MKVSIHRGVAFRLAAWLAAIIVLLVVMHMVLVQGGQRIMRSREEDGRWLAMVVRSILAERTTGGHRANLSAHLRALQDQPDVITIQIFTPAGRLFATGTKDTLRERFDDLFRKGAPCGSCHTSGGAAVRSSALARLPGGASILALSVPLLSGPDCAPCHAPSPVPIGHLHIGLSLEGQQAARARARRALVLVGSIVLVAALGGAALAIHQLVGRPLKRAVDSMERFRSGDRAVRLPVERADEFGYLSEAFNAMAARVEEAETELKTVITRQSEEIRRGEQQLIQQEKMAALGLMAAGIAHEIGNPLTALSSIAQLMHHQTKDEGIRKQTSLILTQIDRISRIVRELTDFSRPAGVDLRPADLNEIVRAALQLARYDRRTRGLEVKTDLAPDLPRLTLVPDQLLQVFFNLVLNAIDAMPSGGRIEIRSRRENEEVVVEIEDSGTGIAPEHLPQIFDPFFTTKKPGAGTGLGLSVSYGIVRSLGGRIEVRSRPGEGSLFRVVLPAPRTPKEEPSR